MDFKRSSHYVSILILTGFQCFCFVFLKKLEGSKRWDFVCIKIVLNGAGGGSFCSSKINNSTV